MINLIKYQIQGQNYQMSLNNLYSKKCDSETYLEEKHLQYLKDKDEDKHEYSKHTISDINVQVETDTEDEDHIR